jgi:Tol biopolymer transport system component
VEPVWSRDGRELFYLENAGSGRQLVAAKVAAGPEFRVVAREVLFDASGYEVAVPHANYDVSPDGQRFVMVRRAAASEIHLVQNWHLLVGRGGSTASTPSM